MSILLKGLVAKKIQNCIDCRRPLPPLYSLPYVDATYNNRSSESFFGNLGKTFVEMSF